MKNAKLLPSKFNLKKGLNTGIHYQYNHIQSQRTLTGAFAPSFVDVRF